ncbi:PQQ-dependent sugar dehydrogenase [Pedobacter aquae]|uniref:PQQ-dependent sugar dehydrogenase n=1 Tax=Pedobacter aquae TaxID=2605747 RepID=A0A5C0VG39_9SPHI|nr:PQQ-dependent sugar dehydrogenase [Pedobacter aquae]QEK51496.1 PQQ-dependent sugar dehydrogenase [Pedobacter aquae]
MKYSLLSFAIFFFFISCKKKGQQEETPLADAEFATTEMAVGLSHPWEIVYGPDNHIWFTERSGKISRLEIATKQVKPLFAVPDVDARGEGGLLGMALHPNFAAEPYVYVVYNYNRLGVYTEKVVRYTYNNQTLSSPLVLLDNIPAANIHNGSRLLISSDLKLFITTGDANNTALAQNKNSLAGKVLRINLNGSIPTDNPTPNSAIWSFGHRNAQGLVMVNGKLYASEHGPSTDDEINLIEKDRNYGWPNVVGACDNSTENAFCTANNVAAPLQSWTPTIATAGLTYYNHSSIPQWKNSLLLVTLKASKLVQLKLNDAGTAIIASQDYFGTQYGRKRAICVAPDGKVYFSTSNGTNDKIIEISRSN